MTVTSSDEIRCSTTEQPGGEPAMTAEPDGPISGQVIVLPGIHGRTPYVEEVARRLAGHGFRAIVADWYCDAARRGGITSPAEAGAAVAALDDRALAAELSAWAGELRSTAPVGVVGYCVGGTVALLAAAGGQNLDAAVIYYGVLRYRGGLSAKGDDPIGEAGTVSAPILAHYGTLDGWCPLEDVDDLEKSFQDAAVSHEVYRYPGAGHAFEESDRPGFRAVAASEAARRTLVFLDHHLSGGRG